MNRKGIYEYYSRPDVQQALLKVSERREVVAVFKDGGFSTRPNILVYPKDIMIQVSGGAVAFHGSLERWSNPMAVGTENYESTRLGWDLVLDIDCELTEHGIVAVSVLLDSLKKHGIKNVSVKFTGGTGFHIGVPFEAMPSVVDYKLTSEQYPDLARKIVQYMLEFSRSDLERAFLKRWGIEELAQQAGKKVGDIMVEDGIDPYKITSIDPILISPRHLFRMPYSLHEKSHLVSIPLDPGDLGGFKPGDASPDKVKTETGWLDKFEPNEASMLVVEAVDWWAKEKGKREAKVKRTITLRSKVPIQLAPPCVQNIRHGLSDGRKRSLFILINYLSSLKWGWDEISEFLVKWNEKNKPPLRESYVRGQVRWHKNRKKPLPPPNCSGLGYYEDFGVCKPDALCGGQKKSIKNPINYALRKLKKR
jgi:DNA primase catalytic subunit